MYTAAPRTLHKNAHCSKTKEGHKPRVPPNALRRPALVHVPFGPTRRTNWRIVVGERVDDIGQVPPSGRLGGPPTPTSGAGTCRGQMSTSAKYPLKTGCEGPPTPLERRVGIRSQKSPPHPVGSDTCPRETRRVSTQAKFPEYAGHGHFWEHSAVCCGSSCIIQRRLRPTNFKHQSPIKLHTSSSSWMPGCCKPSATMPGVTNKRIPQATKSSGDDNNASVCRKGSRKAPPTCAWNQPSASSHDRSKQDCLEYHCRTGSEKRKMILNLLCEAGSVKTIAAMWTLLRHAARNLSTAAFLVVVGFPCEPVAASAVAAEVFANTSCEKPMFSPCATTPEQV